MNILEVKNLTATVSNKTVLKDFNLHIPNGEIHAIMGKNGMGKSSLAKVIAGHPDYKVESGEIFFKQNNITNMSPDCRAKLGIFLAFQSPIDIPGVSIANFIRAAIKAKGENLSTTDFYKKLYDTMDKIGMDRSFSSRHINVGFSGGEKKRCEILQMLMLDPSFAIFDEIDSGLDIDSLKLIAQNINLLKSNNFAGLIITHYRQAIDLLQPNAVHILEDGKITHSGGIEIIDILESKGYSFFDKK